jgi:BioD-like phosphotransacetylase family protein
MIPAARLLAGRRALAAAAAAAAAAAGGGGTGQTAACAAVAARSLLLSSSSCNPSHPPRAFLWMTTTSAAYSTSSSTTNTTTTTNNHHNGSNNSNNGGSASDGAAAAALYLTSPEGGARGATPLLLGLLNYLERHLPDVGYFLPVGSPTTERDPITGLDRRAQLVAAQSDHRALGDPRDMVAVAEEEAALMIASGRTSELLDRIYAAYAAMKDRHDMVVVEGTGVGGAEFEAQVAAALGTPVLLALDARQLREHYHHSHGGGGGGGGGGVGGPSSAAAPFPSSTSSPSSSLPLSSNRAPSPTPHHAAPSDRLAASEIFGAAMLKRQLLLDHGVPLLGVAVNRAPAAEHALLAQQLRRRFGVAGVTFAGAIPEDPVLSGVRLGEVQERLGASLLYGGGGGGAGGGGDDGMAAATAATAATAGLLGGNPPPELLARGQLQLHVDREFNTVVVASQRLEELLEALEALPPGRRPLVVTTVDRLDLVLGLLAAHVSASGPTVAGIMLCPTAADGGDVGGGGAGAGGAGGGGFGGLLAAGGGAGAGTTLSLLFGETAHHPRSPHAFARRAVQRIFEGVARGGMYRGALLPVLATGAPVFDVVRALGEMGGQITPASATKIRQCR